MEKMTRAGFVRSLDVNMPVNEVIERGAKHGLDIKAQDIHSVRWTMRKAESPAAPSPSPVQVALKEQKLVKIPAKPKAQTEMPLDQPVVVVRTAPPEPQPKLRTKQPESQPKQKTKTAPTQAPKQAAPKQAAPEQPYTNGHSQFVVNTPVESVAEKAEDLEERFIRMVIRLGTSKVQRLVGVAEHRMMQRAIELGGDEEESEPELPTLRSMRTAIPKRGPGRPKKLR